ncbi:MAG: 5'-nucleotidase [Planctomycetota bacterium]|jgi:5'-nucleotidase
MAEQGKNEGPDAPWWHNLITSALLNPVFEQQRSIFTNRTLRFDKVKAIGFDFDHTLGLYNCARLDKLAMDLVIEKLNKDPSIPSLNLDDVPEPSFARKGLVVDIQEGNVAKIDRHGHVVSAYHGTTKLTSKQRRDTYGAMDHIPHVTHGDRLVPVDSDFAKPEVLIYSALAPQVKNAECKELWKTIRAHTDMIHRDGSLKAELTANPSHYLCPDLEIVPMLETLREWGMKLFLLTNSEWYYTKAMINTALGTGKSADDVSWMKLFDHVVCEARKPAYFGVGNTKPNGVMNDEGVICGGNTDELEEVIGCEGNEILYVGDHIYADLITSKRGTNWRTMLVISELEEELEIRSGLPGMAMQMKQADDRRLATEQELHYWRGIERALGHLEKNGDGVHLESLMTDCKNRGDKARENLKQFIGRREKLRAEMSHAMNPYWGSLFRAGPELTYYGQQLEDFACTYTSRASNIALYPSNHYFRSSMDFMPHELRSM